MGLTLSRQGAALALATFFASNAAEQNNAVVLPPIDVSWSRIGTTGIVGASTSVITAQDIESSPSQSLPDILSQQVGVQVMHVTGSPNGNGDLVDLRGFGAFAQSNVLVLVNGRRYQDFDLQGFDFSQIPLNSIESVEITRGMSGAVLRSRRRRGRVLRFRGRAGIRRCNVGALVYSGLRQRGDVVWLSPEQTAEPAKCGRQFELPRSRVDRLPQHYRRFPAPESSRHSAKSAAGLSDHA